MEYFFGCSHFGHANIIKYCRRPFLSVEEMDETIIKNINDEVKPNDILYCLGDFCFKSKGPAAYLSRINCKNVTLILGNHDPESLSPSNLQGFKEIHNYLELKRQFNGERKLIVLFHYPIQEWNCWHRGAWHLFSHVHGKPPAGVGDDGKQYRMDVGVDCNDFKPVSLDEVAAIMAKKQWVDPFKKWEQEGRLWKNDRRPEDEVEQKV